MRQLADNIAVAVAHFPSRANPLTSQLQQYHPLEAFCRLAVSAVPWTDFVTLLISLMNLLQLRLSYRHLTATKRLL